MLCAVNEFDLHSASPLESLIRDLAEVGPQDEALAGRKAFHLARLLRKGFEVPPGFVVTTEVFRLHEALSANELALPPALQDALAGAWRRSGLKMAAVRSSANEEDGQDASWAGIFPTVLPVRSADEMIAAVETCFRALQSSSAQHYRRARKNGRERPAMAVLVQSLVDADAAGVIFTANPVTGDRDEIVINAVPGLGEPLASGLLSGDVFVLSRAGTVKSASISAKPFMLTCKGEAPLPPEQSEREAVSETEASALARLALLVENVFGCPQDIEFAIARGRIHLLQTRPITGLAKEAPISDYEIEHYLESERGEIKARVDGLRREGRLRGADAIFSNGNVGELLPSPTPMSFGLFRRIFADRRGAIATGRRMLGYRLEEAGAEGLYELICGQVYFNVEIDAQTFDTGLPIEIGALLSSITEEPARASYPEFGLYCQGLSLADAIEAYGEAEGRRRHAALWRFRADMIRNARALNRGFRRDIEPLLRCSIEAAQSSELFGSNAALLTAFQRRVDYLRQFACVWFVVAARLAFYFADMVRWRLEHRLGDSSLTAPLFQGLDGSLITRQALEIENLAEGRITREAFLSDYGHSSLNELEISLPRLSEDPRNMDRLLRDLSTSGRLPSADFSEQKRCRRAAERDLRERLAAAGASPAEMRAFFDDLRLAQTFLPLRETIKHYYTGEYRALRQILMEINCRLEWEDDDVFYLNPSEIACCFHSPETLVPLVRQRRRQRKIAILLARKRRIPAVIFASDLGAIGARPNIRQSRRLEGMPVSPGQAVGFVRLLEDNDDQPSPWTEMHGDEIIVARSANLGLAPLLRVAAGLVVEVGGVLAHAACQARESGIPAVVLANATSLLCNGMAVCIDGATGRLEVLDERSAAS